MHQLPDLTLYRLIHRGMRSGTARVADVLATMRTPDLDRAARLAQWYGGFLEEFHLHHTVEDTIFFPALGSVVAGFDRAIARVDDEHATLDRSLTALDEALCALATSTPATWAIARGAAHDLADVATAEVVEHLDFEDDEILPLFVRHMSKADYDVLGDAALKQGKLRSLFFTVPFIMGQATDDERTQILAEAPLPLRLVYRASRARYARLERDVFGEVAVPAVGRDRAVATSGKGAA